MGACEVTCKSDSQLVVNQIKGEFEVKEPLLQKYYHPVSNLIARFKRKQCVKYTTIGQDLYKIGYSRSLLKCITKEQAKYILEEIHEGACGNHSGARTMAAKVLRAGYFWTTVQSDCEEMH